MLRYTVHIETKHCYVTEAVNVDLISKKDLLALTGISYGQLYRWKRERLIPEEWFIKQSAYTGQETFFPREQILSRVRTILDAKGQYSLEELARVFSPETSEGTITAGELSDIAEIGKALLPTIWRVLGKERYDFFDAVLLAGVSKVVDELSLTADLAAEVLSAAVSAAGGMPRSTDCALTIFRSLDVYHAVLTKPGAPLWFDGQCDVAAACDLGELAGKLKLNYKALTERAGGSNHE